MGACKGPYGFMRGPIWFHGRADMSSLERAVMCLESQAVSACVNKHFATIIGKTCNNYDYYDCTGLVVTWFLFG